MKATVFATLLVVAGTIAFPQLESRSVGTIVEERIKLIVATLQEKVIDPIVIERGRYENIIAPSLLEYRYHVENLVVSGVSGIEIYKLEYVPLTNNLTFDLSWPEIKVSIDEVTARWLLFTYKFNGDASGSFAIRGMRLTAEVDFNDTVNGISVDFSAGDFSSNMTLKINGNDVSQAFNFILGEVLPDLLHESRDELNRALENSLRDAINNL